MEEPASVERAAKALSGVDHAIQSTIMAIREVLMGYFKEDGYPVMDNRTVRLRNVPSVTHYNYERWERDLRSLCLLEWNNIVLANVSKEPERLMIHNFTMDRSKTMRAVRAGIEEFMVKYLPGVELSRQNSGTKAGWQEDKALMKNSPLKPHAAQIAGGDLSNIFTPELTMRQLEHMAQIRW